MKHQILFTLLIILIFSLIQDQARSRQVDAQQNPPPWAERILESGQIPFLENNFAESAETQPVTLNSSIPWSKVVFQSFRDNNWEIYAGNDDSSGQIRLTTHGAADIQPRFNRGANKIVFSSNRTGVYEIYTMNADGSGLTQLTATATNNVNPAWSPDGTHIAFESYRDGQAEIYTMSADGSNQRRLTSGGNFNGMPAWSPDGNKIAFSSSRTGGFRIWVMEASGNDQVQLSHQASSVYPAWSPDGSKIAFSADHLNSGWLGVYAMNVDGSNQENIFKPAPQTDAWVRSWSPDGRYIAYTLISFTYHQGNWYWVHAFLDAIDRQSPGNFVRMSHSSLDWHPDWQTLDNIKPTSTMPSLIGTSPSPIPIRWSGGDAGGSGLKNFDVQVRVGTGPWTDWLTQTTQTSASYVGVGGQTYAFRVRARDNAYNVQTWTDTAQAATMVESLPPKTIIISLPPFTRAGGSIAIMWGGTDPGGSGIATFDLQYRLNNGAWNNWLLDTTETEALLSGIGQANDTVGLRVRGRDHAQNIEPWPANADATVTLYRWGITGMAHDNTGTPVGGASVQTWPLALNEDSSGGEGTFGRYVATHSDIYSATVSKTGYGPLPITGYLSEYDARLNVALPPYDNLVSNPHFETGSLTPDWLLNGTLPPTISNYAHTGNYAVLMGSISFELAPTAPIVTSSAVGEAITLRDDEDQIRFIWSSNNRLWYRQRFSNGSLSPAVSVPTSTSPYALNAMLDDAGNIHLVWNEHDIHDINATIDVFYAYWSKASNTWSTPVNISNDSNWSQYPRLATDSLGQVHVVWQRNPPGYYWSDIQYTYRNTNGIWAVPIGIEDDFGYERNIQIATDVDRTVHLLWSTTDAANTSKVRYMQRSQNGVWQDVIDVSGEIEGLYYLLFAVETSGIVHVVWREHDGEDQLYHRSRYRDGRWTTPWLLFTGWLREPQLAVAGDGLAHLVWQSDGEIYYAGQQSAGTWGESEILGNAQTFPQLTVDTMGKAHTIWGGSRYGDQPRGKIYYTRQQPNSDGWTSPVNLSPDGEDPRVAVVVADSAGNAHVTWLEGSFPNNSIHYRGPQLSAAEQDSQLNAIVTIPSDMTTPILSYHYQMGGFLSGGTSSLSVMVDNGSGPTAAQSYDTSVAGWHHGWTDLSNWTGQTITVTFNLLQAINAPLAWVNLDSITIGSAQPDVWVEVSNTNALPGEYSIQVITYGNRGGAVADSTQLTYTLPVEISFVSATPAPISVSPLVWDLGSLTAKGLPASIVITGFASTSAIPFTTVTGTAVIHTAATELELLNNTVQGAIYIGRFTYLPVIIR